MRVFLRTDLRYMDRLGAVALPTTKIPEKTMTAPLSSPQELKPCPLCGSKPSYGEIDMSMGGPRDYGPRMRHYVLCGACGLDLDDHTESDAERDPDGLSVVDRWNRRPS